MKTRKFFKNIAGYLNEFTGESDVELIIIELIASDFIAAPGSPNSHENRLRSSRNKLVKEIKRFSKKLYSPKDTMTDVISTAENIFGTLTIIYYSDINIDSLLTKKNYKLIITAGKLLLEEKIKLSCMKGEK